MLNKDLRTTIRTRLAPLARAATSIGIITAVLPSPMFSWVTVFASSGGLIMCLATFTWTGRIIISISSSKISHCG